MRLSLILALAAPLAACAQEPQLAVRDAWVRLPAVAGRPAAAYFAVHGGPADARLAAVRSDVVVRSEIHETRTGANGAATMAPVNAVPVPARGTVRFAPGGLHVMLFGVNPAVKPGGTMTFVFTFADGLRIQQNARVVGAGDPPPQ